MKPTAAQLQLLKRLSPIVHQIAGGFIRKLPRKVLRDDVLAAGMLGLWDAIRRHVGEPETFEWYARIRIRGAIIDELRTGDMLSRYARTMARKSGTSPSPVAFVDPDELDRFAAPEPEQAVDTSALAGALSTLPQRTQEIILRYDFLGERMRDIGDALKISEPRVSQIRTDALVKLRESGLLDRSVLNP